MSVGKREVRSVGGGAMVARALDLLLVAVLALIMSVDILIS